MYISLCMYLRTHTDTHTTHVHARVHTNTLTEILIIRERILSLKRCYNKFIFLTHRLCYRLYLARRGKRPFDWVPFTRDKSARRDKAHVLDMRKDRRLLSCRFASSVPYHHLFLDGTVDTDHSLYYTTIAQETINQARMRKKRSRQTATIGRSASS